MILSAKSIFRSRARAGSFRIFRPRFSDVTDGRCQTIECLIAFQSISGFDRINGVSPCCATLNPFPICDSIKATMALIRIAQAQINTTVGDFRGNLEKISEWIVRARVHRSRYCNVPGTCPMRISAGGPPVSAEIPSRQSPGAGYVGARDAGDCWC